MKNLSSFSEFMQLSDNHDRHFLLLYKSGSEHSDCSVRNLSEACSGIMVPVFSADVSVVRDIHPAFNINTVPALLIFENSEFKNTVKSCQSVDYYKALLQNAVYKNERHESGKQAKNVTVYSTPTCTWCTTLKRWLDKHAVRYQDVDISSDEEAARNLVKRSRQQGVPQTDINGQIVVGFDQNKLKQLLEIQ
jgi:glutaredoxin-like YruB-family protein